MNEHAQSVSNNLFLINVVIFTMQSKTVSVIEKLTIILQKKDKNNAKFSYSLLARHSSSSNSW